MSTFENARTEALYVLIDTKGWGEFSGETPAPVGWFACLAVTPTMLEKLTDVDTELLDALDVDPESLVGFFLIRENDEGEVTSQQFDTSAELVTVFENLESDFLTWVDNILDARADAIRAAREA